MAHPRITDKDISTIADPSHVNFLYDAVFTLREGVHVDLHGTRQPMVTLYADHAHGFSKLHLWEPGVALDTMLRRQKYEDFLAQYLDANPGLRIANVIFPERVEPSSRPAIIADGKLYSGK